MNPAGQERPRPGKTAVRWGDFQPMDYVRGTAAKRPAYRRRAPLAAAIWLVVCTEDRSEGLGRHKAPGTNVRSPPRASAWQALEPPRGMPDHQIGRRQISGFNPTLAVEIKRMLLGRARRLGDRHSAVGRPAHPPLCISDLLECPMRTVVSARMGLCAPCPPLRFCRVRREAAEALHLSRTVAWGAVFGRRPAPQGREHHDCNTKLLFCRH